MLPVWMRVILGLSLAATVTSLAAGIATATAGARGQAPAHSANATSQRAILTVRGEKLHWTRVRGASRYVLAIVAARGTTYRVVRGVAFTPTRLPRQTVRYRVRANLRRAPWSRIVSITYRHANGSLQSAPGHLKVSVNNTTGWGVDAIFHNAGVRYERLDVGDGSDLSLVAEALSDGITPLVLYNPGVGDALHGSLEGVSPSEAAGQVVSLAQRLNGLAVRHPSLRELSAIEFGNEVYWNETSSQYAGQYDAAHRALAAHGLGSWKLLAVATAVCGSVHAADWIPDFIHDMSTGPGEVDGWTVHPYGPMDTDATSDCAGPHGFGWPDARDWHQIAVRHGSTAPWYITEVGQCISGCPNPVNPAAQAADLTHYLNDAAKYSWLVFFNWYASCDDSSGGYGLLAENSARVCGANGTADERPAFNALARWIAVNGGG
jgi:hypothetical protein